MLQIIVCTLFLMYFHVNAYNNACPNLIDYPFRFVQKKCYYNPDILSTTPIIIKRHGYTVEKHKVVTRKGYILTLYRIPAKDDRKHKQPIFLQHGVASSSITWVNIGNRSLAFCLSDEGYDVWLGNIRGTFYSKDNIYVKSTDNSYWNFSLDDLAQNDIPDSIKYVYDNTKKKVIYIGHSLANTLIFMYTSEFPEEAQSLISAAFALCPIVYLQANWFESLTFGLLVPFFGKILNAVKFSGPLNRINAIHILLKNICTILPFACRLFVRLLTGKTKQLRTEDLLLVVTSFDAVSVDMLLQCSQVYRSELFRKFDYGSKRNMEVYGKKEPPFYPLENITIPVHLYYGLNDAFIKTQAVEKLYNELGSEDKSLDVIPKGKTKFSHVDFTYGRDLKELLYKPMFKVIETYVN